MQHLAKVHAKSVVDGNQLQLLAVNTRQHTWEPVMPREVVTTTQAVAFNEQALVLIDLDDDRQVVTVEDATDWVVDFISEYLTLGLTPKALEEELNRAEQWRQSLTLQSQEVRRRALETAARRDEIQNLEKRLKLERETLERKDTASPESGFADS
ncbi:MAG: hypothetical protein AAF171_05895 [Cyanobacteria bacterium P01_A01_bin.116]